MTRELTVDWPWPGEWESIEDVSAFYKDRLYPALSDYIGGLAESDIYIDYVAGPFTIGNLTIGSVLFASTGGIVSQDNDDFYWDATNIRLGINVGTSPSVTLDVGGDVKLDGAVTINDANADKDFRVEGSGATYTHLLFTDASTNRVGINTSTPDVLFHVFGSAAASATYHTDTICAIESTTNAMVQVSAGTNAGIIFCDAASNPPPGAVVYDHANEWMEFIAATNETFYIKNGYVTTADGMELAVGDFGTPTNPFHVKDQGTTGGWGGAYGGVVARFTADENKHTALVIDALTGYDPVLGFCENGAVVWAIRNDASDTDNFEIRYHVGEANRVDFQITNTGNVEIVTGKLSMDTAIATAIDIGNSFTGSQITLTGSSATDHAIEIDGVYSAALIYTHTSSATADTLLWGDMASTATSGDFNGLRPRLTCNAASGGLNARSVYGEVIVGASKYAALAQGVLGHVSYAAGSCTITDICALGAHISQGASLTATNLYGIRGTVQTRGGENISGNDYAMRLENEAVSGNGRQMDGAIQVVNTNMGGGTSGYGYGLDLSGADIATADIILQNSETISNATDGLIALSSKFSASTGSTIGNLTLANGSITDSDGAISFGDENLVTTGTLGSGKLTVDAGAGQAIIIKGISTGDANVGWIGFYDSDGTTRRGYVGDASNADDDIVLASDTGDVRIKSASGNVLIENLTLADGSITDSGGTIDFGDEILNTDGALVFQNLNLSTTATHEHLKNYVYKTGGASNYNDHIVALVNYAKMDDGSNGIGNLIAITSYAWHTQGDIGTSGSNKELLGINAGCNLDGGKVWGNVYGCYFLVDQESGHEITGNVYGQRIVMDLDGTVGGTSYMLILRENTGVDYGFYQDGTAINLFGGNTGIGQSTFGTNATQTLALGTGVAPTTSPANAFQMYSADIGAVAGKAGAHFRDEEGNIVSIGSGGMLMTGTARVLKEIIIGSGSFHKGVSAPDDVYLSNNMHVLSFDKTTVEHGHYSTLVPSDFAVGTTIGVEVDWAFADAEADHYMTWVMEYLLIADGEDPAGAITRTYQKSVISTGNNDKQIHTTFGTGITGATADDTLLIRFFRDSNATYDTDDLDQDAWLLGIHLHYIADKLGQPT